MQVSYTLADKALVTSAACEPKADAMHAVALHAEGTKAFLQVDRMCIGAARLLLGICG